VRPTVRLSARLTAGALALIFAGAVAAQAPTPPLSEPASAAVEAWKARVQALKDRQAAMPPPASVEENLQRRIALDQAVRTNIPTLDFPRESQAVLLAILPTMLAVDADNTAYLKSVAPAEGWFRIGRDGESVASNAFLIVQHSPDEAWQQAVLMRMEPLLASGDVAPQSYALLYDRVSLRDTGKQRYGSQVICADGKMVAADMDAPERVQERRDAIGFTVPRYSDYVKLFEGQTC
jgi:hypothetical protein